MYLAIANAMITLESSAITLIEKGNDLPLASGFLFANEDKVTAVNTCVDH